MEFAQIKQQNRTLRPHQINAKNKIFKAWDQCNSVMLQMPTGTGKTYLFSSIIHDLITNYKSHRREINILIVAHRTELLDQISATLSKFDIQHGFIQGAREQHLWHRVQVASIMSLLTDRNYRNTIKQKFDYIIVDEAHHSLADTYVELFGLFPNAKKLGVTATPWRLNHESFLKLYEKLIVSPQISWFIKNQVLADFDYVSIKPDSEIQKLVDQSEVTSTGDFANAGLDHTFNTGRIRSKLYESYVKFANGRKGIIYAINRIHAARIAEMYSAQGVRTVAIDCETPKEERQKLIEAFKRGEIKILVNVDIFTEGFDCPDVSFIQLARPTRSLALFLQQVGRGLRISEGKAKTIILDNVGLYNYFGLPDANRKWQYHFQGCDVETVNAYKKSRSRTIDIDNDYIFDETKLKEDDEEMMLVRGSDSKLDDITDTESAKDMTDILPEIEEISLADYYLLRGNALGFKIYSFTKKKGKRTDGIGACVYEFSNERSQIRIWRDSKRNISTIKQDTKLYTTIIFTALQLGLPSDKILDIEYLADKVGVTLGESVSLFDYLKILSTYCP